MALETAVNVALIALVLVEMFRLERTMERVKIITKVICNHLDINLDLENTGSDKENWKIWK